MFSTKSLTALEVTNNLSHYIDVSTASIKSHPDEAVDLKALIANLLLDNTSNMVVGKDLKALETFNFGHPVFKLVINGLHFVEVYTQFRRLPRVFAWVLEAVPGFFERWDMFGEIPYVAPLVKERLARDPSKGEDAHDLGRTLTSTLRWSPLVNGCYNF